MIFLTRYKFLLIAITSLGLGIGGIYSVWYAKYEISVPDSEYSYATLNDGTIVKMGNLKQLSLNQRNGQIELGAILGIIGLAAGIYLIKQKYKLGILGSVISVIALILSIVVIFSP